LVALRIGYWEAPEKKRRVMSDYAVNMNTTILTDVAVSLKKR